MTSTLNTLNAVLRKLRTISTYGSIKLTEIQLNFKFVN